MTSESPASTSAPTRSSTAPSARSEFLNPPQESGREEQAPKEIRFLSRLTLHIVRASDADLTSAHRSCSELAPLAAPKVAPDMIVFLDYINDAANRSCLVGVRRMLPGTPLVVVPRTLSALLTTQLLADGAQAVIPPDADPSAVFSVLQLAARGGAYAPPQPAAAAPAESAERADHAGAHRSSARWANRSVTDQQQQILSLIRRGHTNKEISRTLNISHNTTKNHVMRLMRKFKASNRAMLAAMTNES